MFASQWLEYFSGIVSHVGVSRLAQSGLIFIGFLNLSFWNRSLWGVWVEGKLLMIVKKINK